MFFTLRYACEVRAANAYFDDLRQEPADAAQVALAQKLIESKSGTLDLANFTDRYQTVLLDMIKAKIDGTQPVLVQRNGTIPVINLLEALRQSVEQAQKKAEPVRKSRRKRLVLAA